MDARDPIQFIKLRVAAIKWLSQHEPLTEQELHHYMKSYIHGVGEPATYEDRGQTIGNKHLRSATADQFREFAQQQNMALVEGESPFDVAEIFGYPSGNTNTWVPMLLAVKGPPARARIKIDSTIGMLNKRFDKELHI